MITYHGYNNGYNNPVYHGHKDVGAHYTGQNMVSLKHRREVLTFGVDEITKRKCIIERVLGKKKKGQAKPATFKGKNM